MLFDVKVIHVIIIIIIDNRPMGRVFANGPGDKVQSQFGSLIMVIDTALLNIEHFKVRI